MINRLAVSLFLQILFSLAVRAAEADTTRQMFEIKGDWFMAHQWMSPNSNNNAFVLKRGYLTVESRFNEIFSGRYTQDITIDREGDDAGNVELRFKYCYLKIQVPASIGILTNSYFEVGLVHRPWMDFEEKINQYRVQSAMYLDRAGVVSSADFGITYVSLLGGKINEEYQSAVSNSYPGKYGSISLGVYNGGGYHSLEMNNNKTLEGRFTLRPLPESLPGLQLSYNTAFGKSNDTLNTDFKMHSFYLSWQTRHTVLAAQYYTGEGDYSGKNPAKKSGYSFFGEFKIPETNFMVFSRYDYFEPENSFAYNNVIAGVAYRFFRQNRILLDMDWSDKTGSIKRIYELALEIRF